jgi:hypothetical protein
VAISSVSLFGPAGWRRPVSPGVPVIVDGEEIM